MEDGIVCPPFQEKEVSKDFLVRPKLFNVNGSDSFEDQALFGGNPSGISNLNQQRYGWVPKLYRNMVGNFWIPQKVNLTSDKINFNKLTEDEKEAKLDTLAFLIYLDNFQTNNLPNIAEYVTNAGVKNLLAVQTFQEVIHSEAYQYILESIYPSMQRDEVYNRWRTNKVLLKRNSMIAEIAERFIQEPTAKNFLAVICANLILEGVYFYQGFNFFDQLAFRGKSVQTSIEIDYIRRDEMTHLAIFINMLREMGVKTFENTLLEMMENAVVNEIEWCHHTYGNRILGITTASSEQYVKHLANSRLRACGIGDLYEGVSNPYKHLEGKTRGNFFEAGAISEYDMADSVSGWDKL